MKKMIQFLTRTTLLICLLCVGLPIQADAARLVKGIQFKKYSDTLTITKGEKVNLKVTVNPGNASNKKLKWTSSNKKVVFVNSKGQIKGKKKGKAIVTVSTTDGSKKKIKLKVTVGTKVSGLKLTNGITELQAGESHTANVTVKPLNASNKKINWSTSNAEIATVDDKGKITAKKQGSVKITGTAADGSGRMVSMNIKIVTYVKSINLSVKNPNAYHTELGGYGVYVKRGDSFQIAAEILPENATDNRVIWTSGNNDVAIVSANGNVTAVGCGVARITAQAMDNGKKKKTFFIYVGRLMQDDCEFIAHRGKSEWAPENSLAAIRLGLQSGFDCVEFDIWKTKDDEFVVTHDKSLKAMCGVDIDVTGLTKDQATGYKITRGNKIAQYPNEYIASLDQVLELGKGYPDKTLCIELKEDLSVDMLTKVMEKIQRYEMQEQVKIISFYSTNLSKIRSLKELGGENIKIEYLISNVDEDAVDFCIAHKASLGAKYYVLNENQVSMLHKNGIKVNIWTVPDFVTAVHMIHNMKVDSVTLDYQFFE